MSDLAPIRLVVGSAPPDLCGVGDYTERLADALRQAGHDAEVVLQRGDDPTGRVVAGIGRDALVHLQYPSVGMGRGPAPLATLLRRRAVLTLHEYGYAHPLRRAMAVALAGTAACVVTTTTDEARAIGARMRGTPVVIPVPSNVPVVRRATGEQTGVVGWFGLLAPGKGLERFLEVATSTAARAGAGGARRFVVIGGWRRRDDAAIRRLRSAAGPAVHWTGHLPPHEVSLALAGLGSAYLPFPDGASERRASLLALLDHGVPVLTTEGPGTTAELRRCVTVVHSPAEAQALLGADDPPGRSERRDAGLAHAAGRTWAQVARAHVELYRAVTVGRGLTVGPAARPLTGETS